MGEEHAISTTPFFREGNPRIMSGCQSTPLDLMIVDLFLSEGISGGDVIHQVRKILPDLPVILISAASAWEIEAAKRALPTVRVLRKPFSMASLLALIQELKHE